LCVENTCTRVNRGLSTVRASTRCPSSQRRRGTNAAKLMRTCSAMRDRSDSTDTGPCVDTAATTASNTSRTTGSDRAKWAARSPSGAQVCT